MSLLATVAAAFGAVKTINAIVFVISVVMQQTTAAKARARQRKAEEEAEARVDAAKGVQLVAEGQVSALYIPYGRNLIGGNRVYHNTFNSYRVAGLATGERGNIFSAGTSLNSNINGKKHEFLITQQAICFAGIHACYEVDIDQMKIGGERVNALNEVVYDGSGTLVDHYSYGLRVHVYYDGSTADPLMVANDGARATALFTNAAYATCVYRMNRDEPQFSSGVPTAQFYIEGMRLPTLVATGAGYYLDRTTRTYDNNPARVLLDYLTNTVYGKGLSDSELDLESFYNGIYTCSKVVKAGVPLAGGLWRKKGGSHDVKLYECNLALDSGKPIRDNIELILDTMGLSELIWSGGKYRLQCIYPETYVLNAPYSRLDLVQYTTTIPEEPDETQVTMWRSLANNNTTVPTSGNGLWENAISAVITDDDLVREGSTSVVWPNSQSRLNYATVRFLNESKDFTEDSVSWPNKNPTDGSTVYQTFLSIDNGILLETDTFATGISDYYSALAKAEQLVLTSRSSVTYEFNVNRDLLTLEPGDLIKVKSTVLNIPGELLRIDAVTPEQNGLLRISAFKFDAAMLAWNHKDNEAIVTRNLYVNSVANVTNLVFHTDAYTGYLTWTAPSDIDVVGYQIKTASSYAGMETQWVDRGTTSLTTFEMPDVFTGDYIVTVVAVDMYGRKSSQAGWPHVTGVYAGLPAVTALAATPILTGVRLSWGTINSLRLKSYEVRIGDSWATATPLGVTKSSYLDIPPQSAGVKTFWVSSVDTLDNYGAAASKSVTVLAPAEIMVTPKVIDNNVMLYWTEAAITITASQFSQYIDFYEIRRGDTYANSALLGEVPGLFATFFETIGTDYKYWVCAVDIAGNRGNAVNKLVAVDQPPDFILRLNDYSNFVDTTANFPKHTVVSSGMAITSAYVEAGYVDPTYYKCGATFTNTSYLEEVIDTGATIESSNMALVVNAEVVSGSQVQSCLLYSSLDNVTWSAPQSGYTKGLYNFRYIKYRLTFTGTGVTKVNEVSVQLASKGVYEAGEINVSSGDTNGTPLTFTKQYTDVTSIQLTPKNAGGTPCFPLYDFVDTGNPTGCSIYLFNTSGARISGRVAYSITGVN